MLILGAILIYCAIFPVLYFIGPDYIPWLSKTDISYGAIMYYLVFNTLFLIGIGYCVVGCVAYPYSNNYFNKSQKRQTNQRFGLEFTKCAERVVRVLQDMSETQGTKNTSALLLAPMDDNQQKRNDSEASSSENTIAV